MKERQEYRGLQIRFPMEIYNKLKKRAKEEHRSFNAEVLISLEAIIATHEAMKAKNDVRTKKGK